ncbi:hypothetical protein BKM63_06585 [Flavobacterium johnsoniae]|uniref:Uncharacterized protein n=1 Tax=Flavobacterium johnsoniae TaxID=986 RepID=A0A1J7CLT9_FLAJO|nr:hypothetical protein BKM63_06585 [Flavobacterium johnsoniae]
MYKKHLIKKRQLFFADIALKQHFMIKRKNKHVNNIYSAAIISSYDPKWQNTNCFLPCILSDFFFSKVIFLPKPKPKKAVN